ncbi:hypothetical protein NQ315_000762 [Exocentrus adspersus]|uniref:Uncharacterized protein n=1 Tax=Exocentrus adspersus TaxID=1586481 RepID=A0AAV8WE51_9CUCU|nr:hypothetical protein NQ315_000762 [Exocentrus adspersus]
MKLSLMFLIVFLAAVCFSSSSASQMNQESEQAAGAEPSDVNIRVRRSCRDSYCRSYCKTRHPSYSGRCVNGECDCA